jgi:hypothetical protein
VDAKTGILQKALIFNSADLSVYDEPQFSLENKNEIKLSAHDVNGNFKFQTNRDQYLD